MFRPASAFPPDSPRRRTVFAPTAPSLLRSSATPTQQWLPEAVAHHLQQLDRHAAMVIEATIDGAIRARSVTSFTEVVEGQPIDGTDGDEGAASDVFGLCIVVPCRPGWPGGTGEDPDITIGMQDVTHTGFWSDRTGQEAAFLVTDATIELGLPDVPCLPSDLVQRRLGLATPGPQTDTGWYWALVWMSELTAFMETRAPGSTAEAATCVRWHPAVDPDEVDDEWTIEELTAFVVDRHRQHTILVDWEGLRIGAAEGTVPLADMDPMIAALLDDGSFQRWCMASIPPSARLVRPILGVLDHRAQRLLGAVLGDIVVGRTWSGAIEGLFGAGADFP